MTNFYDEINKSVYLKNYESIRAIVTNLVDGRGNERKFLRTYSRSRGLAHARERRCREISMEK